MELACVRCIEKTKKSITNYYVVAPGENPAQNRKNTQEYEISEVYDERVTNGRYNGRTPYTFPLVV